MTARVGVSLLLALGTLVVSVPPARAAEYEGALEPGRTWTSLALREEKALIDYAWRNMGDDVIDNGRKLREMSARPEFETVFKSCGHAAKTLSYMVSVQYYSSQSLLVTGDWHNLAGEYVQQRRACLAELDIDERDHPLPSWFGR